MRPRTGRRSILLPLLPIVALACRPEAPPADGARETAGARAAAPIGRLVDDSFAVVVHAAERFTPPPTSLWTPAAGHEYVALDVALHNTTADSIALGWRT